MKRKIWSILAAVVLLVGLLAITGCVGDDGAAGPSGMRGLQGEQGVAGDTGSQGTTGIQGEQGVAGADGASGSSGTAGAAGADGVDGADGAVGSRGPAGYGSTGATGSQGPSGALPAFSVQLQVNSDLASPTAVYDTTVFPWRTTLHLTTDGVVGWVGGTGNGGEARIVLTPLQPMTLGEVMSISWSEYLVSGYVPHVDIILDTDGDGVRDNALVVEYAYNTTEGVVRPEGQPTYDGETAAWYQTLSDDGNGPVVINDTAYAWLASEASGPAGGAFGDGNFWITTLGSWKTGLGAPPVYLDANTAVTGIEIEVDNWIAQSEAYIDNITVNGVAIPD